MFQFTGLPSVPYVFRYGYRRITSGEFPHSEIPGSQNGQLLPRAYRSRPRPSSALSAKASTVCPCSLDQKNTGYRCRYGVFKVRAAWIELNSSSRPVLQNSTAYVVQTSRSTLFQASQPARRLLPKQHCHQGELAPTGVIAPASLERR
jgi:hypothetical protein